MVTADDTRLSFEEIYALQEIEGNPLEEDEKAFIEALARSPLSDDEQRQKLLAFLKDKIARRNDPELDIA